MTIIANNKDGNNENFRNFKNVRSLVIISIMSIRFILPGQKCLNVHN